VDTRRFWHWNRYAPRLETNAAMRDDDWKLLRPAIFQTLMATPEDLAVDETIKREWPDDIDRGPLPEVGADAEPVPLQLYDLAADPGEQHDLAATEPARVA